MKRLHLSVDGDAPLEVRRFAVQEGLSELFEVNLFCRSRKPDLNLAAILNRGAVFKLETGVAFHQFPARTWTGVVSRMELVHSELPEGHTQVVSTYFVRIKPLLWCLSNRTNHRVFQRKKIPEIVKDIFGEWKLEYTEALQRHTYYPHDYVVQYGESDLAFVRRLLERAGITFFFRFKDGSPTELVLTDQPHVGTARPALTFADSFTAAAEQEVITDLRLSHRVAPGRATVRDFDFRRNLDFAFVGEATPSADPEKFYEQYHFLPGDTVRIEPPGGDTLSTPRADDRGLVRSGVDLAKDRAERILEADRRLKRTVAFRGTVLDLAPGCIFKVKQHPRDDLTKDLLVTEFSVTGTFEEMDGWEYEGDAVFTDVPYTPDETTPKPRILGVQSAVVVGPQNKEIWCDEFGRVRVQFQWDRLGTWDDKSSCWLRVSYGWAGAGFGHITLPRIGQEVLVSFLEGDPDHPVVVGRAFNEIVPIPSENEFPRYATRSTWMSDTEHEPDGSHFNEIRMEDIKDGELMYVQAERNLQKLVKNDETERTGQNRALVVGKDRRSIVAESDAILVGAKYSLQMMEPTDKDKLRIVALGKPKVTPKPTKLEMRDAKIMATASKASAELDGKEIIFEAKKDIHIKAGGNVIVKGGPNIKINCGTMGNTVKGGTQDKPDEESLKLARELVKPGGTGDAADAELVALELAKLPPEVLAQLKAQGTKVVACRGSVTDHWTHLKGVQPRGWRPGSTWDNVPGAHSNNEVVVAVVGHGTPAGAHVPKTGEGHGSANVAIHEAGHALDLHHPKGPLNQTAEFQEARNADLGKLSAYETQAGAAGNQETYAESLAVAYGGTDAEKNNLPHLTSYFVGDFLPPPSP